MIKFEHVTTLGKGRRLQDVSFCLEDGFIMALAGENGAGKTTLLRHILGQEISYEGCIRIDGMDIKEDRNACMRRIAYVSDDHKMPEIYTVQMVCDLYRGFYDDWNQEILEQAFLKLKVPAYRKICDLSRGESFRMQIALGMAYGADVFLMDEVTSGMDPVFRKELWRLMREMTVGGADILLVTHILDEVQQKCDYRGILEDGRCEVFPNT